MGAGSSVLPRLWTFEVRDHDQVFVSDQVYHSLSDVHQGILQYYYDYMTDQEVQEDQGELERELRQQFRPYQPFALFGWQEYVHVHPVNVCERGFHAEPIAIDMDETDEFSEEEIYYE